MRMETWHRKGLVHDHPCASVPPAVVVEESIVVLCLFGGVVVVEVFEFCRCCPCVKCGEVTPYIRKGRGSIIMSVLWTCTDAYCRKRMVHRESASVIFTDPCVPILDIYLCDDDRYVHAEHYWRIGRIVVEWDYCDYCVRACANSHPIPIISTILSTLDT